MSMTRSIVDIWSHIDAKWGGIGPAAASLATAVYERRAWDTHWVSICEPSEVVPQGLANSGLVRIDLSARRPVADLQLHRRLKPLIEQSEVCHVHGMWVPHTIAARRLAAQACKPIVSSVHGNLASWDLRKKGLKKRIYSSLLERNSLARSGCLRALSMQEAEDYRRFGLSNPIAIVPNGIGELERIGSDEFVDKHPELRGKKVTLFLGRVHYQKGILDLLQAWPRVVGAHPDAHLVVAGAEQEDTGQRARTLVSQLQLDQSVTLCGVITGSAKQAALSIAQCFCLPSYSEACSVSVLEALSIGCPVVITPECNMPGITSAGAGWICSRQGEDLGAAVARCLSLSSSRWEAMSAAARTLARTRYSWAEIAAQMDAVYSWLLGGSRPDFVIQ